MDQGDRPGTEMDPEQDNNRRTWARRSILWPAVIRAGGQARHCHLRNLSLGGVRARAGDDLSLPEGSEIVVDIPSRGQFSAVVAWRGGPDFGLSFRDAPERVLGQLADIAEALGLMRSDLAPNPA